MAAAPNRPRPIVLVVDDDPLLRLIAVDIAEEAGFAAIEAGNAEEAVAILEAPSDTALVLTDVNMPGSMDGLKLAHAVRRRWPPIPIIVVSAKCSCPRPICHPIAFSSASPTIPPR